MYENECVCGVRFDNNCAHFLSNWMIEDRGLSGVKNAAGTYCCTAGRPIRAKEMRVAVFESVLGLSKHFNPPSFGFILLFF
jgi:hypothetical protein